MTRLRHGFGGQARAEGKQQHGVASTERHVALIGPLTMVVSLSDFNKWYHSAAAGQVAIYATGMGLPVDNATCKRVRELIDAKAVRATQKRTADGKRFDYRVERIADPVDDDTDHQRSIEAIERDIERNPEGRILRVIKRAANFDRHCPSYAELARECDLPNRDAARYRMARLEDMGLISVRHIQNQRRIVTVISSGKSTRGGV